MNPKSTLRSFLVLAGSSLLAISSASAQATSATWDTNADGDWTDPLNWTGDTDYAGGADNTATFGNFINANRVINLNADITIGNITASDTSHNYTISGANILTLDRTDSIKPVIDVTQSGRTLTISSQISGSDGLQKSGAGILTISNTSNDFTGGITINGGRLTVTSDAHLGDTGNNITLNGGELYVNGNITTARGVTLNDTAGNRILLQGNANWNFDGAFTGDGGITFRGNPNGNISASLRSGSNNFNGALGIESGTGGNITVRVNSLADTSVANGNIVFGAYGSSRNQTFEWASDADAALTLDNRSIEFAGDNAGGALGTVRNANTLAGENLTIITDLVVTGTGPKTLILDAANTTTSNAFNGIIGDGSGTVAMIKAGTGEWALSGANTYSSTTSIGRGTLSISSIGNVNGGASSLGTPSSEANGIIVIGEGNNTGTLLYTGSGHGSDRAIQINSTNNTNNGGAVITNNGSGALTFTAATFNNAYTNDSTVTRGLTLSGSNGGEIQGVIQDNSATNSVGLTKSGDGTWALSGANTYTGNTTVSGGTLLINGDQSLATGAVAVNGTSTLGGNGTVGGNVTVAASATVAPGASVGTLNLAGNLTVTVASSDVGTLAYELGSIAASDKIVLAAGKVLSIGGGALDLDDFNFSNVGGLQNGTYTLIETDQAISGSLGGVTNGTLGSATIDLQISGDGTDLELVVSGLGGGITFTDWRTASGAGSQTLAEDHDNDGVDNGTEFFLGGDTDTTGFTPLPTVVKTGGTLSVTWTKHPNYPGVYTTDFVVETSDTLADPWTTETEGVNVTITGNDVTYTFPNPLGTKKFARLKVTGPN